MGNMLWGKVTTKENTLGRSQYAKEQLSFLSPNDKSFALLKDGNYRSSRYKAMGTSHDAHLAPFPS